MLMPKIAGQKSLAKFAVAPTPASPLPAKVDRCQTRLDDDSSPMFVDVGSGMPMAIAKISDVGVLCSRRRLPPIRPLRYG
jgi:hypothetical protein